LLKAMCVVRALIDRVQISFSMLLEGILESHWYTSTRRSAVFQISLQARAGTGSAIPLRTCCVR
jgi:hypothetical protein